MDTSMEQAPTQVPPALPDFMTDPNAVLKDTIRSWRYGQAPDYSKTRAYFDKTKLMKHEAGSLEDLVQNLVKNWEVEASFKTDLADWRTIDRENYSFSINGGRKQTGEEMLRTGTYNAIIQPGNEYYSARNSDFATSHKTFKRMMPTFAWEVLEVIGAPPVVGMKWRHWGVMKNDYVGFNDKGERITATAHGGPIDVQGTTWAWVDDKFRVQKLETWFDPLEMFRQIAPNGVVNKDIVDVKGQDMVGDDSEKAADATRPREGAGVHGTTKEAADSSDESFVDVSNDVADDGTVKHDNEESHRKKKPRWAEEVAPQLGGESRVVSAGAMSIDSIEPARRQDVMSQAVEAGLAPSNVGEGQAGDALASRQDSEAAVKTHEEMSRITPAECPFMNKE